MATTQKQSEEDGEAFAASFAEPEMTKTEQTEDEAFGITPEAVPEITDDSQGEGNPAAVSIAAEEEAVETPAEETMEGAAGEEAEAGAEPAVDPAAEEEPAMTQNDKTWEGRLRKREEEINAREQALKDKEAGGGEPAAEEAAPTEGGMTPDEAMAKLSEDFGPEFVEMIKVIASGIAETAAAKVATDAVGLVGNDVQEIIAHLQDAGQRAHFKEIAKAHPDFLDVANSPEFKAWSEARPDENKASEAEILEKGSAEQVIKLFDEYKASLGGDEPDVDAAEGVRSSGGGISLPELPAETGSYEEAWDKA